MAGVFDQYNQQAQNGPWNDYSQAQGLLSKSEGGAGSAAAPSLAPNQSNLDQNANSFYKSAMGGSTPIQSTDTGISNSPEAAGGGGGSSASSLASIAMAFI